VHELGVFALGALLVGVPAWLFSARLSGRLRAQRAREAALRAALEARFWGDQIQGADRLEADLRALHKRAHEANNALSTALLSAEFLAGAPREEVAKSKPLADQQLAAGELVDALRRLRILIDRGRMGVTTVGPRSPLISSVAVVEAVHAVAASVGARHRDVSLEVALANESLSAVRVAVCAGAEGLHSALAAVLENACEGDGVRRAEHVVLRVGAEGEIDTVALEVSDDGPGFAESQLAAPVGPFASTKLQRLGLGLYTAERILRASGGSLRRENPASGGARVSLFLPVASELPRPQ
jgi:signal transduction histidine kinase